MYKIKSNLISFPTYYQPIFYMIINCENGAKTTLLRYRIRYDRMNIALISTNKSVLILLETAKKKMKDMSLLRDSYLHCFFGTNVPEIPSG